MELDFPAIFSSLADYVSQETGINCYDFEPDAVACPAFVVASVEITPNTTMAQKDDAVIQTYVLVDRTGDSRSSQLELSRHLCRGAAGSVRLGLEKARAAKLGGLCGGLNVKSIQGHRQYLFGSVWHYGARLEVRVVG
jgi:hypothetical protein